jgi:hypothetical protein
MLPSSPLKKMSQRQNDYHHSFTPTPNQKDLGADFPANFSSKIYFKDLVGEGSNKRAVGNPHDPNTVLIHPKHAGNEETVILKGAEVIQELHDILAEGRHAHLNCGRRFVHLVGTATDKMSIAIGPRGIPIVWEDSTGLLRLARPPEAHSPLKAKLSCVNSWLQGRDGPLLRPEVLQALVADAALAVLCLHLNSRAHGDLKTEQIILDCDTSQIPAKLVTILTDLDTLMPVDKLGMALPSLCRNPWTRTEAYVSEERASWLRYGQLGGDSYNAVSDDLHALRLLILDLVLVMFYEIERPHLQLGIDLITGVLRKIQENLRRSEGDPGHPGHILSLWKEWSEKFMSDTKDEKYISEQLRSSKRRFYSSHMQKFPELVGRGSREAPIPQKREEAPGDKMEKSPSERDLKGQRPESPRGDHHSEARPANFSSEQFLSEFEIFLREHHPPLCGGAPCDLDSFRKLLSEFIEKRAASSSAPQIPEEVLQEELEEAHRIFVEKIMRPLRSGTSVSVNIFNGILNICRIAVPFGQGSWGRFFLNRALDASAATGAICMRMTFKNSILGSLLGVLCLVLRSQLYHLGARSRVRDSAEEGDSRPPKRRKVA